MNFIEYINNIKNYNKTLLSLRKDKYYDEYRKITHQYLIDNIQQHEFDLPRLVEIPKDKNSTREIFVYNTLDNFIMKLVNNYLYDTYSFYISERVFSYKMKVSCGIACLDIKNNYNPCHMYLKIDLNKYFNSPNFHMISKLLNKVDLDTSQFHKLFENKCYNKNGEIINKDMGLLPGAPISAYLSNAYLYEFDKLMEKTFSYYIRYSDDIVIDIENSEYSNIEEVIRFIEDQLQQYELKLNMKKVNVFSNGKPIEYLGCVVTNEYIDIGKNKFNKVKDIVRKLGKKYQKYNVDGDTKIKYFFGAIYTTLLNAIVHDTEHGGILGFWFSCVTTDETLKQLDYYILDTARYVYSGKHNKGALKQGYDTSKLESLGFVSIIKLYDLYRTNKLIYVYECQKLIKSFFYKPIVPMDNERLFEYDQVIDLFTLFTNHKHLSLMGKAIEDIIIDIDNNCLICNKHKFMEEDEDIIEIDGVNTKLFIPDYGVLAEKDFLYIVKQCNLKTSPFIDKKPSKNNKYIPIPKSNYGYYEFSQQTKKENYLMLNLMLFLIKRKKLNVSFDIQEKYKYIISKNSDTFFIIERQKINI